MTSVPRLMPSMSEWRQPYLLSNLLLVTESLTLMAGNSSVPAFSNSYRRWTPVVVSSVTPMMLAPIRVYLPGCSASERRSVSRMIVYSSESFSSGCGTTPAASYSVPMWISSVASPPSSTIESGPEPSGQLSICSVHHQYSSSVSPFQAKTGMPCGLSGVPFGPTTIAAAAWSWVEKMLQLTQRTSAPRSTSVSIRTAVWIVMWSEPMIRAPASGFEGPYSSRHAMRPGISTSASSISLRPHSARERSATLKSVKVPALLRDSVVVIVVTSGCCARAQNDIDGGRPGPPDDSP